METKAQSNSTPRGNPPVNEVADTVLNLVDTAAARAGEAAEMLGHVPYVRTLTGVIGQVIGIRDEMKLDRERCLEIINGVLHFSVWICSQLCAIKESGEQVQRKLESMRMYLNDCERTLNDLLEDLKKHQQRTMFERLGSRGRDNLNALDRSVGDTLHQLQMGIISDVGQASSNVDSHALPAKPKIFVERDEQLDKARKILLQEQPSRIVILGGGGFGKTTMALSILHDPEIANHYKSNRYFLSCEAMTDVGTLSVGLAQSLGLDLEIIPAKTNMMLTSIRDVLQTSPSLLCLDNFETPWEPSATRAKIEEILAIIADIPNLSLIITMRGSQRPLQEHWSDLGPLLPISLNGAESILREIAPMHTVNESTRQLLDAIAGIPLAVTLVAALLRDGESAESLWEQWSKGATGVVKNGDNRESNLSVSIQLSVECARMKKNPEATKLLAALSQLPHGFSIHDTTLESLQKHLGIKNIDNAILTLRRVALISQDTAEIGELGRIRMLPPIRLFCKDFFESFEVFETLINYFVDVLLTFGDYLGNPTGYPLIVPELSNIHAVFQKGYKDGHSQKGLLAATLELDRWSGYKGYHARETVEMAVNSTPSDPILRARLFKSLGNLYKWEGNYKKAKVYLSDAVAICRQNENYFWEAQALTDLGGLLISLNELDETRVVLERSIALYHTEVEDPQGEANVIGTLGNLYMRMRDFPKAKQTLTAALEIHKRIEDGMGHSNTANRLCQLSIYLHDPVEAEKYATEALNVARGRNYPGGEGNALYSRGRLYFSTDRVTDARKDLEEAIPIFKQHGGGQGWLNAVDDLAQVYIQLDELKKAEELLTEVITEEPDSEMIAIILTTLGWLYVCGGRLDKAELRLKKALELFEKFESKPWQAEVLARLGPVYLHTERVEDACSMLESIPGATGGRVWSDVEMRRLWALGDVYIARGKFDEAQTLLDSAMESAKLCKISFQQGNILRSMGTLQVERGRLDLAVELFNEALELHRKAQWVSEQAIDLNRLGAAYAGLGRTDEAGAAFDNAGALMKTICDARILL